MSLVNVVTTLALSVLFACPQNAAPRQTAKMNKTPREEVEEFMNALIPVAQQMLAKHGEFYPYGGAINTAGKIVMVGATEGDHPASQKVIDGLNEGFRSKAKAGEYRATGLVFDVKVKLPKSDQKTDAIQINLDHAAGLSIHVFLPYQIKSKGDVAYGEMFAQQGDAKIFKQ